MLKRVSTLPAGESIDPVPPSLLRKYVAYARKYVQPRLSQPAARVLQEVRGRVTLVSYGSFC